MKIYDKLYLLKTGVPNYILRDISEWNVGEAVSIAREIEGVYAFRFQRRGLETERISGQYNVKAVIIKESGTYYLGGYIETVADIKARISLNKGKKIDGDRFLISRLESGGHTTVVRSVQNGAWTCVYDEERDTIIGEE